MFLDDSQEVAKILHNLIEGSEVRHALLGRNLLALKHRMGVVPVHKQKPANSCNGNVVTDATCCGCVAGRGSAGVPSVL